MPTYYSTGLPDVDDTLGGGLPPGSVTVLETPPASAGILMAASFAAVPERPTVYLTTDRTPDQVERDVAAAISAHRPSVASDSAPDLSHLVVTEFDDAVTSTDLAEHAEPAGAGDAGVDSDNGADVDDTDADDSAGDGDEADGDQLPAVPDAVTDITIGAGEEFADAASAAEDTAPYCLVFDALTALVDAPPATWTRTLESIRSSVDDLGGVAMLVLPRAPGRDLTPVERRVLQRADATFRYQPGDRSGNDVLAVPRLSGAARDCADLPVHVQLDVGAALEKNPDETFS